MVNINDLTQDQQQIILIARDFYLKYHKSPSTKVLVKLLQDANIKGADSIYLHKLFPDNPAVTVAKLANIPPPLQCL